jgi:hypothetical protein
MLDHLLNRDDADDGAKKITMSLAIEWIKRSWSHEVKSETISNCWRKVGLQVINNVEVVEVEEVEYILPYEDNENWEHDVLFPLEVQEVEEDYVDLEVSPPPSLKEIQETWNRLKTLIIRRSSERLLSAVPDFDHLLREEINENRPTLTQTPISSYFQDGLEAPSDARSVVE